MEPNLDTISLEEFMKTELKIGIVTLVRPHSNADKLMVLEVDIGGKVIPVVAGIKKHYTTEQMIGKQIVVVTNLTPTVLRGEPSHGMLLAAKDGDNLALLVPDKTISAGSKVA